jgi:hypothetical protein
MRATPTVFIETAVASAHTQRRERLVDLSFRSPLLMVFLRHFGCTFCREALADIAEQRGEIEARGVHIVAVHMSSEAVAAPIFEHYGLADLDRISDPDRHLYRAFGLKEGSIRQLMGPRVWWRGFVAGILRGHGVGRFRGNGFQMPGAFVFHEGGVVRSLAYKSAADRPDYVKLAESSLPEPRRPARRRAG